MRAFLLSIALAAISLPALAGDYDVTATSETTGQESDGTITSYPGSSQVDGTITDPFTGEELDVSGQWTGRGTAEVTDDYGNTYDLELQ